MYSHLEYFWNTFEILW